VCLRYHLGTCGGVCEGRASAAEYAVAVRAAVAFLSRGHASLLRQLRRQLAGHAARLEFEQAARLNRYLVALEGALEPQAVERDVRHDQDVLHVGAEGVLVLHVRRGKVLGCTWSTGDDEPGTARPAAEASDRFLLEHYRRGSPPELIVNRVGDRAGVEAALEASNGYRVRVTVPPRSGGAAELLRLCGLNHAYRATRQRVSSKPDGG
jgi:excinuclease ABC subunit C